MVSWFLNIQRSQETKTDYSRRLIEETEFQLKVRILRNRVLHGKTIHCSVKDLNSKQLMLMHVTNMHRITAELEKLLIMLIYYLYFDSFSRVNQTFFLVVTKNKTIKRLLHQLKFLFAFKTSSIEENLNICNWQQVTVVHFTVEEQL